MAQSLATWALPRLAQLLPLDEDSLKQIVAYTDSLSKPAAADHLKNLLGDSPQALEFISTFQSRRSTAPSETEAAASNTASRDVSESEVPRPSTRTRKKKQPFNKLPPPRQVEPGSDTQTAYIKRSEDDYIASSSNHNKVPLLSNTLALQSEPDALQLPVTQSHSTSRSRSPAHPESSHSSRLPPSAAGTLISDATISNKSSRSVSPANASKQSSKTKVNLSGGTSMRGASAALSDLDSAIRALEIQTNPTLSTTIAASAEEENKRRRCNCMAQRHPLLAAAPNCLSCGKIVCLKEGLGPCTFCGKPLLSSADLQAMIRILREERGKEKMQANNATHKRAEVSQNPRPFTASSSNPGSSISTPQSLSRAATPTLENVDDDDDRATLAAAKAHRDRLLRFQAQNVQRTTIRDEAADFSTPSDGQSLWASPQERALQLKRQQKALREQEWSARPEWEKRRVVVSLDVKGGKAVRRMAEIERPATPETDSDKEELLTGNGVRVHSENDGSGKFSRNPLLGGLIKPVFRPKGKDKAEVVSGATRRSAWRRVQDDNDDNEQWILDGGAYGDNTDGNILAGEERACG